MAWKWMVAAMLGSLVGGCGSGAPIAPAYVGRVTDPGQDAVVGAVSDGVTVSFYVCGGASSYATESRWLLGKGGPGGAVDVSDGGWHVTGDLEMGSGQITTDQAQTLSWRMRPSAGGLEGVYQAMDGSCRTGAVVADFGDGQGTRLQGTWCDGASHFAQVTPIKDPLTLEGQGIAVQVEGIASKQIVVAQLLQPLPLP